MLHGQHVGLAIQRSSASHVTPSGHSVMGGVFFSFFFHIALFLLPSFLSLGLSLLARDDAAGCFCSRCEVPNLDPVLICTVHEYVVSGPSKKKKVTGGAPCPRERRLVLRHITPPPPPNIRCPLSLFVTCANNLHQGPPFLPVSGLATLATRLGS